MDYPLRFINLENYEPGDEIAELLFDLKENVKLRRADKGVFASISMKDSHTNIL